MTSQAIYEAEDRILFLYIICITLGIIALLADWVLYKYGIGLAIGNIVYSFAGVPEIAVLGLILQDGIRKSDGWAELNLGVGAFFLAVFILELAFPQIGTSFIHVLFG